MNKRNENANKGFSLVELIIVVAIMAVLMGVLAPQYMRYVERTRLQKDNSAIAEIANAAKIAMADEAINSATSLPATLTIGTEGTADAKTITFDDSTALGKELQAVIGASYTTSSNAYKNSDKAIVLTISETSTGTIEVKATAGWIDAVGGTPGAKTDSF